MEEAENRTARISCNVPPSMRQDLDDYVSFVALDPTMEDTSMTEEVIKAVEAHLKRRMPGVRRRVLGQ